MAGAFPPSYCFTLSLIWVFQRKGEIHRMEQISTVCVLLALCVSVGGCVLLCQKNLGSYSENKVTCYVLSTVGWGFLSVSFQCHWYAGVVLYLSNCTQFFSLRTDEYKMKGVEEVKYMRGEEDRVNARNQENLVREERPHTHTHVVWLFINTQKTHRPLWHSINTCKQTAFVLNAPVHRSPPPPNTHSHGASRAGRDNM